MLTPQQRLAIRRASGPKKMALFRKFKVDDIEYSPEDRAQVSAWHVIFGEAYFADPLSADWRARLEMLDRMGFDTTLESAERHIVAFGLGGYVPLWLTKTMRAQYFAWDPADDLWLDFYVQNLIRDRRGMPPEAAPQEAKVLGEKFETALYEHTAGRVPIISFGIPIPKPADIKAPEPEPDYEYPGP